MHDRAVDTNNDALAPWAIDGKAFPSHRSAADKLLFTINYAVLAPSSHNAQPWRFRLSNEALELYSDPVRSLPVADPSGREQVISCGAALFNLRIALLHFGYGRDIALSPQADEPELLARVRLGAEHEPTAEEDVLFAAIPRRHTCRFPYEDRPLSASLLSALQSAAREEGAQIDFIEGTAQRSEIASLVAEGDRRQYDDLHFRKELALWVHPHQSQRHDGLPDYAFGAGGLLSYVGPLATDAITTGKEQNQRDLRVVAGSPHLAILSTSSDTSADWMAAGQALQRVLLRAAAEGVSASFLNQPIQLSDLRARLRVLMGGGFPQMLIRLGYGPTVKPTPRRPVSEVLETILVDEWY